MPNRIRYGMTLVEVLVVIAIIGVAVSMILPAVQEAREASRRMHCLSNLKQLGVAMHNYHTIHSMFPVGAMGTRVQRLGNINCFVYPPPGFGPAPDIARFHGWRTALLPMLEQQSLYSEFDLRYPMRGGIHARAECNNLSDPTQANYYLGTNPVDVFLCPSATEKFWSHAAPGCEPLASTNYIGTAGEYDGNPCSPCGGVPSNVQYPSGVFLVNQGTAMRDITDGSSSTIAVGEFRPVSSIPWVEHGASNGYLSPYRTYHHAGMLANVLPINAPPSHETVKGQIKYYRSFASNHPGGAQFLFCDGSAKFIAENIDFELFGNLFSKNGNDLVSGY